MSDESSEASTPLPFSQRPVDKAPGHWVLARAGKRVLRPGGAALTRSMLSRAGLAGADVVATGEAHVEAEGSPGRIADGTRI